MKEKEPQNLEEIDISKELSALKKVNSLITVTLVTLDFAIPANIEMLNKFPLGEDGWKTFNSKTVGLFREKFNEIMSQTLEKYIEENESRDGGTEYITGRTLLGLIPEWSGVVVSPGGVEEESSKTYELTRVSNIKRKENRNKPGFDLDGRFIVQETVSKGFPQIILSFYHEHGRSMVLIKDDLGVKVEKETLAKLKPPHLVLLDARDLLQGSFLREAIGLVREPENFVVVSLGTKSIMSQLTERIKLLHAYTQGETGFAGNRGEVEAFIENWGGVRNLAELILQTKLRFLLETDGKNGAVVHYRIGDKIHSAAFAIPSEEVFKGDTTNAGDIFLAYVIKGLRDGPQEGESIEDWLYRVLENASKWTLEALEKRAKDSKENGQG